MEKFSSPLLIKALKAGDLHALERAYKHFYPKLFNFSKKFNLTTLEPDDFVQETFIKIWEGRSKLKDDVLFDKQVYVIARNLILNHIQREKKLLGENQTDLGQIEPGEVSENSDESRLAKINGLIDKLPPKRKEIFVLHKLENLTYKEIAVYLGISPKTIAHQIYLATIFLKEEIKK